MHFSSLSTNLHKGRCLLVSKYPTVHCVDISICDKQNLTSSLSHTQPLLVFHFVPHCVHHLVCGTVPTTVQKSSKLNDIRIRIRGLIIHSSLGEALLRLWTVFRPFWLAFRWHTYTPTPTTLGAVAFYLSQLEKGSNKMSWKNQVTRRAMKNEPSLSSWSSCRMRVK